MAGITRIGPEFLVNTLTAGIQEDAAVAQLAGGGFVVTWDDRNKPLGDNGIGVVAQVFDASGVEAGDEFLVNTAKLGPQRSAAVTGLTDGRFVVAWCTEGGSSPGDVKAQIFAADGTKIGAEFLVNTHATGSQILPAVTELAGGGFVVSWADLPDTMTGAPFYAIKAQVYDAAGGRIGGELTVNSTSANADVAPSVTTLSDGDFLISWVPAYNGGGPSGVSAEAQRYSPNGTAIGGTLTLKDGAGIERIAGLAAGGFVAVGTGVSADGHIEVVAQVFDERGDAVGTSIHLDAGEALGFDYPVVDALDNGGFVVSWLYGSGGGLAGESLRAQAFDGSGHAITPETAVTAFSGEEPYLPDIAALGGDRFVVTWTSFGVPLDQDLSVSHITGSIFQIGPLETGPHIVDASPGKETLSGSVGPDLFVFAPGDSKAGGGVRDVINDFTVGTDKIDLSALHLINFDEVSFKEAGSGLVVYADTNGNGFDYSDFGVTLAGVHLATLGQDSFIL